MGQCDILFIRKGHWLLKTNTGLDTDLIILD